MSGLKTIHNSSSVPLFVVLYGRLGNDPSGGDTAPVAGSVPPGGEITLTYGTNQNPYLNTLEVSVPANGSDAATNWTALTRGGPGTLDNLFNANSTVVIGYNAQNYGFALSAHN